MAIEWTDEELAVVARNRARLQELWREPMPAPGGFGDVWSEERDTWIGLTLLVVGCPFLDVALKAQTMSSSTRLILAQIGLFLAVQGAKRLGR